MQKKDFQKSDKNEYRIHSIRRIIFCKLYELPLDFFRTYGNKFLISKFLAAYKKQQFQKTITSDS